MKTGSCNSDVDMYAGQILLNRNVYNWNDSRHLSTSLMALTLDISQEMVCLLAYLFEISREK